MLYEDFDQADVLTGFTGGLSATEPQSSSANLAERALLRAILQEAILDVRGYATGISGRYRRRAAQEAYYWILSRNMTWPFSFESICAVLGFDASCLRAFLLRDAAVGANAVGTETRSRARRSPMVRAVRAARMRGNQQKQPLRAHSYVAGRASRNSHVGLALAEGAR